MLNYCKIDISEYDRLKEQDRIVKDRTIYVMGDSYREAYRRIGMITNIPELPYDQVIKNVEVMMGELRTAISRTDTWNERCIFVERLEKQLKEEGERLKKEKEKVELTMAVINKFPGWFLRWISNNL